MHRFLQPTRTTTVVTAVVAGVVIIVASIVTLRSPRDSGTTTATGPASTSTTTASTTSTLAATNIYAEIGVGKLSPAVAGALPRVYVPNGVSDTVSVIDPTTLQVIDTFSTGREPQHVVPSWDMKTLWVLENQGYHVIPIDPSTGAPGEPIPVDDPYNLYFTPDGTEAIVVAEALKRLDFRDPHTMELHSSLSTPDCAGINHGDYSADGGYLIMTCEFAGKLVKIDMQAREVVGTIDLSTSPLRPASGPHAGMLSMPQDLRAGPDGRTFYAADMMSDGVFVIDGDAFELTGFVPTGVGAHGIYPSRDGTRLYIANRGSNTVPGPPGGPGSVSVLDPATNQVVANWPVPGGGSPDMGNVSADGAQLWLAGRFDDEVYVFDTITGELLARIPVGDGPHGLTIWPQPGRFSLGHTGNMR